MIHKGLVIHHHLCSVARTNVDNVDGTTGMPTIMLGIWTEVMNFKAL